MREFLHRIVFVPVLLALLAGCGGDTSSSGDSILRRGNGGEPGSLDPALAQDIHAFNVLADLYEGLLTEGADGQLVPGAASSWEISDDGLTYSFRLRDDGRWSDGSPVTAADFVRGFQHVASPDTNSAYSFLLEPIAGFAAVKNGSVSPEGLGVEALGTTSLKIRLAAPAPQFLAVLSMPVTFPLHEERERSDDYRSAEAFLGNGPYVLDAIEHDQLIRLRRNDQFRDTGSVAIDVVEYLSVVDLFAELNLYRADDLHITNSVPGEQFERLVREYPGELRVAPTLATYYLAFDLSEPPFDDPKLRKALSMVVDRDTLVRLLARGESPAYALVPPGTASHLPPDDTWQSLGREARLSEARQLYKASGYGSDKPLEITYLYDAGDVHERIALAVSAMWQDELGVEVRLEKLEWMYFLDSRDERNRWDVMRFSWFGDYNDPMTFLELFRSDSSQNLPRYSSAEYDALLNAGAFANSPDERRRLLSQAEGIFVSDHAIAPLYFYVSKHMVKPEIQGFDNNAIDRHPSRYLSIRD